MRVLLLAVALIAGWSSLATAEPSRTWTSRETGAQFTGSLVAVTEERVSIQRDADGVVFEVPKATLSEADLKWITQQQEGTEVAGDVTDLSGLIAAIPSDADVPAVAVLLVEDGRVTGTGVAGIRKAGDPTPADLQDKWHWGSCTKSMTATLAAAFVEEGSIRWDTTVQEILGKELKMREEYEDVTLGWLLANRGGVPGQVPDAVYASVDLVTQAGELSDREILKQRLAYAEAVLNLPPVVPPGSEYQYSNSGFIVAGAMLEKVAGKPWEKLVAERIFGPLGLTNTGFGNAAHDDRQSPSQPWPHKDSSKPVAPGRGDDNVWVLGPAGTVNSSLLDAGRYLAMHARCEVGPVLKQRETFEFLHTALPDNRDYARGWIVTETGWSKGPAISHDGSNTMNYCSFWVAPQRKAAVAAFTNCGKNGRDACMAAIRAVVEAHLE